MEVGHHLVHRHLEEAEGSNSIALIWAVVVGIRSSRLRTCAAVTNISSNNNSNEDSSKREDRLPILMGSEI